MLSFIHRRKFSVPKDFCTERGLHCHSMEKVIFCRSRPEVGLDSALKTVAKC